MLISATGAGPSKVLASGTGSSSDGLVQEKRQAVEAWQLLWRHGKDRKTKKEKKSKTQPKLARGQVVVLPKAEYVNSKASSLHTEGENLLFYVTYLRLPHTSISTFVIAPLPPP
jgi:hypothetical protein